MSRAEGSDTRVIHSHYRSSRYPDQSSAQLAAQVSIANIVRAFSGIISRGKILKAIGNAKTPNEVSLAVRTSLKIP